MPDHSASASLRRVLPRLFGDGASGASVELKPFRGGLEATEVALVTARFYDSSGRPRLARLVMKRLEGRAVREATVYRRLASAHAADMSPRLVGVDRSAPGRVILYLEAIRRVRAWPWRDRAVAGELLKRLSRFHVAAAGSSPHIPHWDYEAEHESLALETRTALDRCRRDPDLAMLAREFPPVSRVVLARRRVRRQLLEERPFGQGPIHGDVHPGNALVRRRNGSDQPVLLDWGRARLGSPLEDVASWLHSLGVLEPEVLHRHDSLLAEYLATRGMDRKVTHSVRAAYWLASASNALSGALLHHLDVAADPTQSRSRRAFALRSARAWLRVVRRADAWWS